MEMTLLEISTVSSVLNFTLLFIVLCSGCFYFVRSAVVSAKTKLYEARLDELKAKLEVKKAKLEEAKAELGKIIK